MTSPVRSTTFFDDRFGHRYVIFTDVSGNFLHATRYFDRNPCGSGHDYYRLEDLPPTVRHPIELLLRQLK